MSDFDIGERFLLRLRQMQALNSEYALTQNWRGGGPASLAGYTYQLQIALLALLRRYDQANDTFRDNPDLLPVFLEGLSDHVEIVDKLILANQVKLTLSRAALSKALDQFWSAQSLFEKSAPFHEGANLAFRLIYRSKASEASVVHDIAATINRWQPPGGSDASAVAEFKSQIDVVQELDPEEEILVLLANTFLLENPLECMREWMGSLLANSASIETLTGALRSIWSKLRGSQNAESKSHIPAYIWSTLDRPPTSVSPGSTLVGPRPSIRHLRDGYFAPRQVYAELAADVEAWIAANLSELRRDDKIKFFWLGGRSGSGKSVALLHILAHVHASDSGRTVLWLGDDLARLPSAIRWARPLVRRGRDVIIGLDDPFSPANGVDAAKVLTSVRQEMSLLQGEQGAFRSPLIVCCGPSEHRNRVVREFTEDVDISTRDLPKETAEELKLLWEWFQLRTGRATPYPYEQSDDILLVQLFFEWKTGQPLPEFAARFRWRIRALDETVGQTFERFITLMLAANRLYINYPQDLLAEDIQEPAFESAFRLMFSEDQHLSFDHTEGLFGIRLSHPHLANAIYTSPAWYPGDLFGEPDQRAHLERLILRSVQLCKSPKDRLAILWAIAQISYTAAEVNNTARLSRSTVENLLRSVTTRVARDHDTVPVYMLPVFLELQARFPTAWLAFSPIRAAIRVVRPASLGETGLRLLCHKLIQHSDALADIDAVSTAAAMNAIRSLLDEAKDWTEWPHIAFDYRKITGDSSIDDMLVDWLARHMGHPAFSLFLQRAIQFIRTNQLANVVVRWVTSRQQADSRVIDVLADALRNELHHPGIISAMLNWLERSPVDSGFWNFAWEVTEEACPDDHPERGRVLALGMRWLNSSPNLLEQSVYPGLLARLLRLQPESEELRTRAWNWLLTGSQDTQWALLWESVVVATDRTWGNRTRLLAVGRLWILDNYSHSDSEAWPGLVVRYLAVIRGTDDEIVDLACRWITSACPDDHRWQSVWLAVEIATRQHSRLDRKQFFRQGLEGILASGIEDHINFAAVWETLFKAGNRQPEFLGVGLKWIERNISNPLALFLLPQLLASSSDFATWTAGIETWVATHDSATRFWPEWYLMAAKVRLTRGESLSNEFLVEGEKWLNATVCSPHERWSAIWTALWKAGHSRSVLSPLAISWLEKKQFADDGWPAVWLRLAEVDHRTPNHVYGLAFDWLSVARPSHRKWSEVWLRLWSRDATDALRVIASQWLESIRPNRRLDSSASAIAEALRA